MTVFRPVPATPTALMDLDPYRFPAARIDHEEETPTVGDDTPPAPEPSSRRTVRLAPSDRRRLELHAALTTAGIAPLPGDLDAVEALCTLDDTTHAVLRRWLSRSDGQVGDVVVEGAGDGELAMARGEFPRSVGQCGHVVGVVGGDVVGGSDEGGDGCGSRGLRPGDHDRAGTEAGDRPVCDVRTLVQLGGGE